MGDLKAVNAKDGMLYAIHQMLISSNFLELEDYLCSASMYSILGRSNQEDWYSHFIAWLLNPRARHNLGDFSLKCFLTMVRMKCNNTLESLKALPPQHLIDMGDFIDSCVMPDCSVDDLDKELTVISGSSDETEKGRLDIAATFKIKQKGVDSGSRLLLVVENKVRHSEMTIADKYQTQYYADWAYRKFKARKGSKSEDCPHFHLNDESHYFDTPALGCEKYRALVFLSAKKEKPKCSKFIGVDYGDLVRLVILPVLAHPMISAKATLLIREFLREIVSNGYAYTPEIETLLNNLLHEHGVALRRVYELCFLDWCESQNWLGADNSSQRHNFELNWMLKFCDKEWWAGVVRVHGRELELKQNDIPITRKGHWNSLPERPHDEKLWTKNADMKVVLCDGRDLAVDDCWKEYCDKTGIGDDGKIYAKMICTDKGLLLYKIARWMAEVQGEGSEWRDLFELWDLTGEYD